MEFVLIVGLYLVVSYVVAKGLVSMINKDD